MSGIAGLPEITDRPRFDKPCAGSHALPAPLLRTATPLLHSIRSGKMDSAAPSSRRVPGCSGAAGRHSMDEEARRSGALDPGRHRGPPRRSRWGRRAQRGSPHRDGDGRPDGETTYAALDLGTNNCRLLVARPSGDSFRVVDAFSRIIRLGEGISASGRISEAAIVRAVEALAICRDKMASRSVARARLIATEACRAAANGAEFR